MIKKAKDLAIHEKDAMKLFKDLKKGMGVNEEILPPSDNDVLKDIREQYHNNEIYLMGEKIEVLSKHVKEFKKDKHSSVGLLKAVNKRKKLLDYLKRNKLGSYKNVISKLNIRK